ncbi:MAG: hypothetical protein JSV61_11425 [Anaerolineales bacterium]|nr:MAG: hypothetical protein JSV61_11425 [Anaerolineales bacterium]
MAIYLDSALISAAQTARELGWVSGITTNPTLLAQSELSPNETLQKLAALIPGEVCYQITATDLSGMLVEGRAAHDLLGEQTVLKIPATTSGFQAVARLAPDIPCAVTAIFSPAQALVAQAAGARYVIPYVNRSTRLLGDGPALVQQMAEVLARTPTKILAASIKTPAEAVAAWNAGAQILSLPLQVLLALGEHELTHQTAAEFSSRGRGIQH